MTTQRESAIDFLHSLVSFLATTDLHEAQDVEQINSVLVALYTTAFLLERDGQLLEAMASVLMQAIVDDELDQDSALTVLRVWKETKDAPEQ